MSFSDHDELFGAIACACIAAVPPVLATCLEYHERKKEREEARRETFYNYDTPALRVNNYDASALRVNNSQYFDVPMVQQKNSDLEVKLAEVVIMQQQQINQLQYQLNNLSQNSSFNAEDTVERKIDNLKMTIILNSRMI